MLFESNVLDEMNDLNKKRAIQSANDRNQKMFIAKVVLLKRIILKKVTKVKLLIKKII